jgi:sugar phosphate isomerase/epimerase
MKIAFSTLACPDWTWWEVIEKGAAYGYQGVEIRLLERDTNLPERPEFQENQLAQRRRELSDLEFQVCGLGSSIRFDHTDAHLRMAELETGKVYLHLAKELGAEFVRVFGDVLPAMNQAEQRTQTLGWITEGLQALGELAEPLGLKIVMETHGDFSESNLARNVLQAVESPAVGVLWDTHHPWRFYEEPLAETHERLKPWLMHAHWKDSITQPQPKENAESDEAAKAANSLMSGHRHADYVLFGGGEFPAEECMRLMESAGYDGWHSYEWENMWHPEIEDPEIALPLFPRKLLRLSQSSR